MSILGNFKALFLNQKAVSFGSDGIKDEKIFLYRDLWQYDLALSIVSSILSNALINTKWRTYKDGELIYGEEWLRFNLAMNEKESAAEFYSKLSDSLIKKRKALIVELSTGLFVADSWSFKGGQDLVVRPNTFQNVQIGDFHLKRAFKENETCLYIQLPALFDVEVIFKKMEHEFSQLRNLTNKAAEKAMGTKLVLKRDSQKTIAYDEKESERLQRLYVPLMEKANAMFFAQRGEEIIDLTEKQRGSEVQLVIEAISNTVTINHEILCNVGRAYCIPKQFMLSEYTQENEDVFAQLMTWFVKPILKLLSDKFTLFLMNKDSILSGSQIKADLNSIRFVDTLSLSNAVDKLISSSAYTINEIREKIGDDPIEGGDQRMLTKNYEKVSKVEEEGGKDENET